MTPAVPPVGKMRSQFSDLRVAIVHYWFVRRRGGERVVEELAKIFPHADLYTLVADPAAVPSSLRKNAIHTSFVQCIPGSLRWHRYFLPLYPIALEQFDLRNYDLVISSESGPAKGVITSPRTCHICYCHSPMRYLWDMYHSYRNRKVMNPLLQAVFSLSAHYLRIWDLASASRVDYFVANSHHVARRIRKYYGREATVIYPPVTVSSGYTSDTTEGYYLVVSQLTYYKRIDLAIEACNHLRRPLRIVGEGEEYKRLRRLAGPTIQFLGFLPDPELHEQYARCRALLFPGEEDFGIVPVEAQSFGRPVIAYGRGGALETTMGFFPDEPPRPESATGVFFRQQSEEALAEAILAFERLEARFSPELIRSHAKRFDAHSFREKMEAFVAQALANFPHSEPRWSNHAQTEGFESSFL